MSAYPQVKDVVFASGEDRSDAINAAAERYNVPPRLLVALAIGESNLNEAAERWGSWPDVSFGPFQQTVKYAPVGDGSASAANIATVREAFTQDFAYALEVAAKQLAMFWHQYEDGPESMARYNWPAQGLRGNPNATHIVRAWAESAEYVTEETAMADDYKPTLHHDTGTTAGAYATTPRGVILHGSRSGVAGRPIQEEYDATRRYAASGIELGWTATIGDDAVSLHMSPHVWGWNARGASGHYLAVEFAQPTVKDTITDGQVRAFCYWLQTVVLPRWPDLDVTSLPTHAELPEGASDGKSDVYPRHDPRVDELRARIAARLAESEGEDMDCSSYISQLGLIAGDLSSQLDAELKKLEAAETLEEAQTTAMFGVRPIAETIQRVAEGGEA